jgi:hypothetical protein
MNQVKVSVPDGSRFKAKVIADPNETAGVAESGLLAGTC